jgi:peptide/nickel transport system permease protein
MATLGLGGTILSIASLGFLGIGVASPTPEWGTILAENRTNIIFYPYLGLIPGMFIGSAVMCLNFVGDGLRDALDPRTKN